MQKSSVGLRFGSIIRVLILVLILRGCCGLCPCLSNSPGCARLPMELPWIVFHSLKNNTKIMQYSRYCKSLLGPQTSFAVSCMTYVYAKTADILCPVFAGLRFSSVKLLPSCGSLFGVELKGPKWLGFVLGYNIACYVTDLVGRIGERKCNMLYVSYHESVAILAQAFACYLLLPNLRYCLGSS